MQEAVLVASAGKPISERSLTPSVPRSLAGQEQCRVQSLTWGGSVTHCTEGRLPCPGRLDPPPAIPMVPKALNIPTPRHSVPAFLQKGMTLNDGADDTAQQSARMLAAKGCAVTEIWPAVPLRPQCSASPAQGCIPPGASSRLCRALATPPPTPPQPLSTSHG